MRALPTLLPSRVLIITYRLRFWYNRTMNNCIFCKIVEGVIPSHKVYEDDRVLAFLDINPVSVGHTLLIPKEHYRWIQDMPDDLVSYSFIKVKELILKLKEKLGANYVQLSVIGEEVAHVHIWLVPRVGKDNPTNFSKIEKDPDYFEKVLEKLNN